MQKGKGKPFLEVFASAIHEDYRFPILEIFVFLYVIGTFVFAGFGTAFRTIGVSEETAAYMMTASVFEVPFFVFIILVFKNLSYGLGNDIERGIIQTYLSYPLRRNMILTAKLLSAIGLAFLILFSIQISSLYLLAPDIVIPHFGAVLLTYAANLSPILFISGIILLVTLTLKKGGLALVVGIISYFAFVIASNMLVFVALATKSQMLLQATSVLFPEVALGRYYGIQYYPNIEEVWAPTFPEVALYIGVSYLIMTSLLPLHMLISAEGLVYEKMGNLAWTGRNNFDSHWMCYALSLANPVGEHSQSSRRWRRPGKNMENVV